jgi:hypothetical protein
VPNDCFNNDDSDQPLRTLSGLAQAWTLRPASPPIWSPSRGPQAGGLATTTPTQGALPKQVQAQLTARFYLEPVRPTFEGSRELRDDRRLERDHRSGKMPLSEVPPSLAPRSEASAISGVPFSETPTPRGNILLSCLVQEGEDIVLLGVTSTAYTAAQVKDDGSETSASSGVPLSETPKPRGTIMSAASGPRIEANWAPTLSAPSSTQTAASA